MTYFEYLLGALVYAQYELILANQNLFLIEKFNEKK